MAETPYKRLREQLDALASRGESYLKRYALRLAVEKAAPGIFAPLLIVPGLFFAAALIGLITGRRLWPFGAWETVGLTIALAAAWFLARVLYEVFRNRIDRRVSLALFDRELGLKDRIQAADEFSAADARSGFQIAAIEDAVEHVQRALDAKLEPVAVAFPSFQAGNWRHAAAAVAVLVLAWFIDGNRLNFSGESKPTELETAIAEALIAPESEVEEQTRDAERPAAEQNVAARKEQKLARTEPTAEEFAEALRQANEASGAQASTDQSGASGGASQQNRSDDADSSASGQGASSKKNKPPKDAASRKPKDPRKPNDEKPEENNESSSGITGGKGSSSGSKTSSSDKQAADNKAQRDDSEDDAYDDADEEEDEEQEAASAARPLLNQRKAPVDRSLTPSGAGEARENPNANGRSGPGGLKKTRGVAAMLLGVPMPDQLRGQANPGRMKVQRERSEPEEKFLADVAAADRGAIDDTVGLIAHQGLAPWMQDVVRDYFLAERESNTSKSE